MAASAPRSGDPLPAAEPPEDPPPGTKVESSPLHDASPQLNPTPAPRAERANPKGSNSKALSVSIPAAANLGLASLGRDCRSFSQLLARAMACSPSLLAAPMLAVPCFLAPAGMLKTPGMTGPFAMSHQAVLATVTAQAHMQLQVGYQSPISNCFSLNHVPVQQWPLPKSEENIIAMDTAIEHPKKTTNVVVKTVTSDGYNWRKYGQKPAKHSESLRSYYKCTDASCSAKKKVARCPDGHITEVIYHGEHNHECPLKENFSKEGGSQRNGPSGGNENIDVPTAELNDSLMNSFKLAQNSCHEIIESLRFSSDCEVDDSTKIDKDIAEPDPKRRACESPVVHSPTLNKIAREQKVLVRLASNAGLENDGYRWRKYGQKNIKGSPNPRSYYKCTYPGCPIRKHVERASDDVKAIIVTYEGKHNHGSEFSRSDNELPPTAPLVEATVAVSTAENKLESTSTPNAIECLQDADVVAPVDMSKLEEKTLETGLTVTRCNNSSSGEDDSSKKCRPELEEDHAAISANT